MTSGWKTVKLGEMSEKTYTMEQVLSEIIDYRGKTPKKSETGIPTLSAKSVKNNRIDYSSCYYISPDEYKRFMVRGFPRVGDVLLTTEAPLGMVARLDRDDVAIAQRLLTLRGKESVLDNYYLLLWLQSQKGQAALKAKESGTTVTGIKQAEFRKIEISLPPLDMQRRIAAVLKPLDDKIELNARINARLERVTQALFKRQFVRFESTGGTMPPGWRVGTLSEIAHITSGKRPPVKSQESNEKMNIPLVGAASVMGFTNVANHTDKILIIGRVGTHGVVQRFNSPCWASDNTLIITSRFYEYVYQQLHLIDYSKLNRGSTQPLITQGDMNKIKLLIPTEDALNKYEELAGTLMSLVEHNTDESRTLARLRDVLLPRLMSGAVDVGRVSVAQG